MADEERLHDLMAALLWPPTSPEALKRSVVAELAELQALRDGGPSDQQFADWRAETLDGLAANRHPEGCFLVFCAFLGLACAGLLVYRLTADVEEWARVAAWVAGAMLAFDVVWGWRLARGLAVKRRLTVEDRLGVVEELQGRGLVSTDEAAELRSRIARLGSGRSAEPGAAADGGAI